MDDLEESLDRMGMCIEGMEREKEEILGCLLRGEKFEAGMIWKDFDNSLESLKLELSEARNLV
jgi:hypothetical protein